MERWLSDHPDPGNRVVAVQEEIRYLPKRNYNADSGQLPQAKRIIAGLPAAPPRRQGTQPGGQRPQGDPQAIPSARPSTRLTEYRGREVTLSHPDNWQVVHADGNSVTIAARAGIVGSSIGYGMITNFHESTNRNASFEQKNQELMQSLIQENPGMRATASPRRTTVNGFRAMVTRLETASPYQGLKEIDTVVSFERPGGLFYLVLVAPDRDLNNAQRTFDQIINSVRFPN